MSPIARHGRLARRRAVTTVFAFVGGLLAVALVSTVAVAGVAAWQLASDLGPGVDIGQEGEPLPQTGAIDGPVNILLVGSDSGGGNKAYGSSRRDPQRRHDPAPHLAGEPHGHRRELPARPARAHPVVPRGGWQRQPRRHVAAEDQREPQLRRFALHRHDGREAHRPRDSVRREDRVRRSHRDVQRGRRRRRLPRGATQGQARRPRPAGRHAHARGLVGPPVPAQPVRRRRRQRPQPDQQPAGVPVGRSSARSRAKRC